MTRSEGARARQAAVHLTIRQTRTAAFHALISERPLVARVCTGVKRIEGPAGAVDFTAGAIGTLPPRLSALPAWGNMQQPPRGEDLRGASPKDKVGEEIHLSHPRPSGALRPVPTARPCPSRCQGRVVARQVDRSDPTEACRPAVRRHSPCSKSPHPSSPARTS